MSASDPISYTIIGGGRIGTMLASIAGGHLIRRGESIAPVDGPIIVCTRNNDLQGVCEQVPADRRADLVFVQNGMLSSWLEMNNLSGCTRALLYVAVSTRGALPVDGGRSVVNGPHAAAFANLMARGGLQCRVVDEAHYEEEMIEKFLWNCVFGLLSQHHGCSVGAVVEHHREEVHALTMELLEVCESAGELVFPSGLSRSGPNGSTADLGREALVERLCAYSLSIPDYRGAVKEWTWRNGWLWDRSGDRTSLHGRLLRAVVPKLLA